MWRCMQSGKQLDVTPLIRLKVVLNKNEMITGIYDTGSIITLDNSKLLL